MRDPDAGKSVHTACVRRKNPEGLRGVVAIDGPFASGTGLRRYVHQHAAADSVADFLLLAVHHFAAVPIAHSSANQDGVCPTWRRAGVRAVQWREGGIHL